MAESQTDVTKAAPYGALGLDYGAERRKAPADAALDVIRGLKTLADRTPTQFLGTTFTSRGLGDLGISQEDFRRIKDRPLSELEEYRTRFQKDRGDLNVTDPRAKAWEDLNVQLDRAGTLIKNVLVDGLTTLTGPLSDLSETVAGALKDFLQGGLAREAIDELGVGIVKLDNFLKDPAFHDAMKQFSDDIVTVAKGVGEALHWIAGWLDPNKDGANPGHTPYDPGAPNDAGPGGAPTDPVQPEWLKRLNRRFAPPLLPPAPDSGRDAPPPDFMRPLGGAFSPISYRPSAGVSPAVTGGRVDEAHDFFRAAGWSEAQTAGLLANLGAESGFDPGANNATGHRGIAQWDANRQARFRAMFGHDPGDGSRSDYEQQLWFVQWELTHTEKAAGDRLRAMGRDPGSSAAIVDRGYERSEGTTTGARMGAATQYMQQFKDRSVKVLIQNNTGGNANVTATQLQT